MTLGSMMAVMTCVFALFTDGTPAEENYMGSLTQPDILNEWNSQRILRNLKANEIDDDDLKREIMPEN